MKNNNKPTITKKEEAQTGLTVVNQQIVIRSADRTPKDIGTLQSGLRSAESRNYQTRTRLYDLYDDILRDAHLSGIIEKRIAALLNKEIRYEDAEGVEAPEVIEFIGKRNFKKMRREMWLAKAWGITVFEFIPGKDFKFYSTPRKHIKPLTGTITIEQSLEDGVKYEGLWNFWQIGEADDLGFLLKCAPYAIYKRGAIADWAQYCEIFGMPVRIIKYDAQDPQTSTEIDKALDESGSALVLKIPKQADFDIMDGKQSNGNGDLQNTLRNAMNEEMSVLVLGNTETTTSSKSSGYAQSKIHGKQQLEITRNDMADEIILLNDEWFINILRSYGAPVVEGGKFIYSKDVDPFEVQAHLDIIARVINMGEPVDETYIYDVSGIPKPENYEEAKAALLERNALKLKLQNPAQQDASLEEEDPEDNTQDTVTKIKNYIANKLSGFFD